MHQHASTLSSRCIKMYLSTRFKLWNPGVASSPMGVKLVALSFDLSRARGFGGVSCSSLAAVDAKLSACFLRWSNIIMCYPKIYVYICIYVHIDQWNNKEIDGFLILFGSLPQRTMSFSISRCDLASPGCLAGGTCTSKGRWWSQSTSLQSGGLAWASGITRRQGWRWVAKFWKNFANFVCWKVDDQTWKFPRFTKVIVGYQGLKKHQLISVSYWLCLVVPCEKRDL